MRRPTAPAAFALVLALAACSSGAPAGNGADARDPRRPVVRLASFDFPESQILAEVYAQALEENDYPVQKVMALGSLEVVEPALEQGKVDFVPAYLGTAVNFIGGGTRRATADPVETHAQLRAAYGDRGFAVLAFAPAQDQNAFAVTRRTAAERRLRRISDLAPLAGGMILGGPPECPERPLCLRGLEEVYGLRFKGFQPMPSRSATAQALEDGEIGVGMLETTDARLAANRFVLLEDDRRLQPAENVVPVVRREVVQAYGDRFVDLVDSVTARLDTADLIRLNQGVELAGRSAAEVAADWLRREGLLG